MGMLLTSQPFDDEETHGFTYCGDGCTITSPNVAVRSGFGVLEAARDDRRRLHVRIVLVVKCGPICYNDPGLCYRVSTVEYCMPLEEGSILYNRYRIEGILGQGGMGAVYRAFDVNLGVEVAVKENLFTNEEYARQFRREATILASLRHPNLPRVTDHFVIEGQGQYLVMDFIQGYDLRERLERDGAVSEKEALPWFLEICDALAYLHSRTHPILHRDIKPGNIKIMPGGTAVLVDFGLAKEVREVGGVTSTGAKAMTPGFSPPEQYGTGRTDPRTDIYSLGATMYAALTASIPEDSIERAMGREKLTPLRKRNPEVSSSIARVVEKALSVAAEDRFQTVSELANALKSGAGASRPTLVRDYAYIDETQVAPARTLIRGLAHAAQVESRARRLPLVIVVLLAVVLIAAGTAYAVPDLPARVAAIFAGSESTPPPQLSPVVEQSEIPPSPTSGFVIVQPSASPAQVDPTNGETAIPPIVISTSTATPQAPATPTGGGVGQITFASDRTGQPQIYLVNVDGTGLRQLTNQEEGACQPAWSPDGMRLIFTSPCFANRELYQSSSLWLVNLDETGNISDTEPLPVSTGGHYDAAWAPDGIRIAFTSYRDKRPQIYTMNLDGSELVNLNDDLAHNRQPSWSPTGAQLVFTSSRGGDRKIWIMPDFPGEESQFSYGGFEDSHADWSRDGQLVLFERRGSSGIPYLVAARYEDAGRIDNRICGEGKLAGYPMAEPAWSPDGRWVAFETWPDGQNHEIGIATASCTQFTMLTVDPALDFDATWRPTP